MKVKDLMTKKPITMKPNDTLGKVVHTLYDKNISGCPVVSNGKLIGVVTQTDVIRTIDVYEKVNKSGDLFSLIMAVINSSDKSIKLQLRKLLKIRVRDFMNPKVIFIGEDEDVYKAANLINRHEIDRLPVIRNGKLTGILTKKDMLKLLEEIE